MPALYIVATPIGNLEDITLRALRVLREVGLIAAEDTRTTRKLLNHYDIRTSVTSYYEHNRREKIPLLMDALKTRDVALVSEAGMPGISDPGRELVLAAVEEGVSIVPIPGASSITSALAISGLTTEGALFLGFLPRRKGERRHLLESLRSQPHTIVAFEAPHRLRESLDDLLAVMEDRSIAVCRELTKVHEEVFRGSLSQAAEHFTDPRGEFTLVIAGAPQVRAGADLERAKGDLITLKREGLKAREAVDIVAQASGLPKKEVYKMWLEVGSH